MSERSNGWRVSKVGRLGFLAGVALATSLSCSDEDGAKRVEETPPSPYSTYSIKIQAGADGRQVDLPPLHDANLRVPIELLVDASSAQTKSPFASPKSQPATQKRAGTTKPQTAIETPDGGVIVDGELDSPLGWALVYGAAYECGMGAERVPGPYPITQHPIVPPWTNGAYFVFSSPPTFCDQQVAYEETLLCIADKLAQVAEAPMPLVWNKVPTSPSVTGMPEGPWRIPPQATKDRFIARDVALHIISLIGFTDLNHYASPPGATALTRTCARAYGETAAITGTPSQPILDNIRDTVFGIGGGSPSPYLPPVNMAVRPENFRALAESHMLFNAHILRAASRLLHDQLDKGFAADMAGAEHQRALATDPDRGARLMWGAETESTQPYNSLAHAARLLTGRLETGLLDQTSLCSNVDPMKLLGPSGLGPEYHARYTDRGVTTSDQALATKLIDRAGIVVPEATILSASDADLRRVVSEQLIANAAAVHGLSPTDPDFAQWGQGQAVQVMVDGLAIEDIRFALRKSTSAYRQLTSTAPDAPMQQGDPGGGLTAQGTVASLPALVGGIAIDGGIPRQDLTVSFNARAGGLQTASQCHDPDPDAGAILADTGKISAFQDPYFVADTLRKRMVALREEAKLVFDPSAEVVTVPNGGAVEVRTWAGPGRIVLKAQGDPIDQMNVFLIGFNPEDFAVASADQIASEVVLVHGPPWVADCAARTRASCPEDFDERYVLRHRDAVVHSNNDPATYGLDRSWARTVGSDGAVVELSYETSSAPTNFNPDYVGNTNPVSRIYVVSRHNPTAPTTQGRVLGAFAPKSSGGLIALAVSVDQEKKTKDSIGVDVRFDTSPHQPYIPNDSSTPPNYCEFEREPFVPLENELTSDSDQYESSWRHYLKLAKEAAARADELGQELIDFGFNRDLRREAAGEELAQICGDYSAQSEIPFDPAKGTVGKSLSDKGLNACLNETRFDVVFLTTVPKALSGLSSEQDKSAWLRTEVLRCSQPVFNENPLCDSIKHPTLTYDALGIMEHEGDEPIEQSQCDVTTALMSTIGPGKSLGGYYLQDIANEAWVSTTAFRSILSQLELRVTEQGTWKLLYGGSAIMDTEAPSQGAPPLWPYCINVPAAKCDHSATPAPDTDPLAVHFDRLFRRDLTFYNPGIGADRIRLLWRVQGALWMLGGLADEVPAGVFNGYVPAANLAPGSGWGAEDLAPLSTVYAEGGYAPVSSPPGSFRLNLPSQGGFDLTDSDIKLIGTVRPVDPEFDYSETEAPEWLKAIYDAPPGRYLHVPARNRAYVRGVPPALAKNPKYKTPDIGDQLGTWFMEIGWGLHELKCSNWYGQGDNQAEQKYKDAGVVISKCKLDYFECAVPGGPVQNEPSLRIYHQLQPDFLAGGMLHDDCSVVDGTPFSGWTTWNKTKCLYGGTAYPEFGKRTSNRRPSVCPPDARMTAFVNSSTDEDKLCTGAVELTQALGIGCALSAKGLIPLTSEAPTITSVADLPKLERWLGDLERISRSAVSRLYLQHVPERVVKDFREGSVGSGSLKGTHGQLILELESAIQQIGQAWPQMAGRFKKIRAAIEGARLQIKAVELQKKIEEEQLVIARWQAHASMAHALADAVAAFQIGVGFNPVGGVAKSGAASVSAAAYIAQLEAYANIEKLQGDLAGTNTALVLNTLEENTSTLYAEAASALGELRKTTASAAALSEAVRFSELSAQQAAALGAGASFFVSEGDVVEFPVNIVLNRQYDVARLRYEAALKEARYLAYVAQIAVEQRLGRRLASFTNEIGPLDPPAKWAPTLCSLTGVDYEKLSDIPVPDGGFSDADGGLNSAEFADMFIGDWVDKLEKFVEFYNMEYPSHDGDDIAVVSLRDDLLGPGGVCFEPSKNLLRYSSDLRAAHVVADESGVTKPVGWLRRGCSPTDATCLRLEVPETLSPPSDLPDAGGAVGGATWLHEVEASSITDPGELSTISSTPNPARLVYQAVILEAKQYTLSWWDQARDPVGAPAPSGQSYPVVVFDDQWSAVVTQVNTPHVIDATQSWARRELVFNIATAGTYYVAFAASDSGSPGDVVIANVQLEVGPKASQYQANGASPLAFDTSCAAGSAADLQQAFQYTCAADGACFYELATPVAFSTFLLDAGASKLVGKIAKSNFNFRHISLALNVVGSGVLDCALESTPSCYGSGYVEYTLDHSAFDVEVLSHEKPKEAQHFNFGLASINRGKALAAERVITLPLGNADQALLAQPAFEKPEFMGRPLDGSYGLRIYDKPALQWGRVEDIQVVLKYRYWSRIQPYPTP